MKECNHITGFDKTSFGNESIKMRKMRGIKKIYQLPKFLFTYCPICGEKFTNRHEYKVEFIIEKEKRKEFGNNVCEFIEHINEQGNIEVFTGSDDGKNILYNNPDLLKD